MVEMCVWIIMNFSNFLVPQVHVHMCRVCCLSAQITNSNKQVNKRTRWCLLHSTKWSKPQDTADAQVLTLFVIQMLLVLAGNTSQALTLHWVSCFDMRKFIKRPQLDQQWMCVSEDLDPCSSRKFTNFRQSDGRASTWRICSTTISVEDHWQKSSNPRL